MGICWSEPPLPPVQQATVIRQYANCRACGGWVKQANIDYCELCLQKNAASYITPSAPPYQPQYTYAVRYPQQQYTYQQPVQYVQANYVPQQYPPVQQRPQMGTGTAMATGFVMGAIMEDLLDPSD